MKAPIVLPCSHRFMKFWRRTPASQMLLHNRALAKGVCSYAHIDLQVYRRHVYVCVWHVYMYMYMYMYTSIYVSCIYT